MEKPISSNLSKKHLFNSSASLKTFSSSIDSTLDFPNLPSSSPSLSNSRHSNHSCEYVFGLEMVIEDIRSQMTERKDSKSTLSRLISLSHYDAETNKSLNFIKNPAKDTRDELSEYHYIRKCGSLEAINDYFFNNLDLIDSLEQKFKEHVEPGYFSGRYAEPLKDLFLSDQVAKLEQDVLEMQRMKEKLKSEVKKVEAEKKEVAVLKVKLLKKSEKLKQEKRNIEEQAESLKKMMKENEDRIYMIKNESLKIELEKMKIKDEITDYNRRAHGSISNPGTPIMGLKDQRSPKNNQRRKSGSFKSLIDQIKLSLESKTPPKCAIEIIENLKKLVREINGFQKIEKIDLMCLKNAWEVRDKTLQKYENLIKEEAHLAKKSADSELAKIKNLVDRNSKTFKELEILSSIRQQKKEMKSTEIELKLIMNAVYSLQFEILNSIEVFKNSYEKMLKQNNELKENLSMLLMVSSKMN